MLDITISLAQIMAILKSGQTWGIGGERLIRFESFVDVQDDVSLLVLGFGLI